MTTGSKQGDPISPDLFNSLLERQMSPLIESWREKGYGIRLERRIVEEENRTGAEEKEEEHPTNLRYADDVISYSWQGLKTSSKKCCNS